MKKLCLIILLLLPQVSLAAVGFDVATVDTNGSCTTGTSFTWVHEGGGASVTALVAEGGNLQWTSATYNGESLIPIAILNDAVNMWGISASTTNIIASGTVTVATGNDVLAGGSVSFTGTATGTAITSWVGSTSTLANANTNSYSIALGSSAADSMNIDLLAWNNNEDVTVSGTGQTERATDVECAAGPDANISTQTGGNLTMSGSWATASNRRALAAEIEAAAAAPAAGGGN